MGRLPPIRSALFALAWVAGLAAAGCSKGGDTTPGEQLTVLTTETVTSAGGDVTVHSSDVTVDGFTVSIPSGALRTAQDTITIAKAPAARQLNAAAVTAGAIPVSATIKVSKTSPGTFRDLVQVTIPYDATAVGSTSLPVVLAWDDGTRRYEAVEPVGIDRALARVTVRARYFARYTVFTIPGLYGALAAGDPLPPGNDAFDTQFLPSVDGFAVGTFSTQATELELGGNCFALPAFASWYFTDRKAAGAPALFERYRRHDAFAERPQRDDVARELIHHVFVATLDSNRSSANGILSWSFPGEDSETLTQVLTSMRETGPQLLALSQRRSAFFPGEGHAVLAYAWDPQRGLSVYDPGWPGEPRLIPWANGRLGPYVMDAEWVFTWIGFTANATFQEQATFLDAYRQAELGWPDKAFDSLSVTSPAHTVTASGDWAYEVSTTSPTLLQLEWSQPDLWRGQKYGETYPRPSYAHVFVDGDLLTTAAVIGGLAQVHLQPRSPAPSLLEVAISNDPRGGALEDGYEGFLRAQLVARVTCPSVAGPWHVDESVTISCSGSFGSGSETETGAGTVQISQSGCNISFRAPMNTLRSGTIAGNVVRLSGPAAVVQAGVVVTRNRIDFTGNVSPDARRIDLTGAGSVEGSYQGIPGACGVSSTEVMTR